MGLLDVLFWAFLALYLLSMISQTVRFYLRLIAVYFVMFTGGVFMIPIGCLNMGDTRILQRGSWLCRMFLNWIIGVKWKVVNHQSEPVGESCVYVANHQSALDIIGMMETWSFFHPMVPVLKKELLFSGPFGIGCWLGGALFLDRSNTAKARELLNKKIEVLKEKKVSVWVFPEGTRNSDGSLLPFKRGAFHMAVRAQSPIVPVLFSSYAPFYNPEERKFEKGEVTVHILPPVSTKGLTAEDVPRLSDEVRTTMLRTYLNDGRSAAINKALNKLMKDIGEL